MEVEEMTPPGPFFTAASAPEDLLLELWDPGME